MRTYVVSSILIIVGLFAIAYRGTLPTTSGAIPYLSELSSALMVGGLLSILFKVFQEKQAEQNLRRRMRIHDSVDELGLVEIIPESQGYNYTSLLDTSDSLCIVMNDGLRWVGNNAVSLQSRFSKKDSKTEVFLLDPDSKFTQEISAKFSTTPADYKKKIESTHTQLLDVYNKSQKRGSLVIYKLKNFPTRSIFLSEHTLVETPYQTASGRVKIPVYVYRKVARLDSPFSFAAQDIEALRNEAVAAHTKP